MVTIDVLKFAMYAQLALSVLLFFSLQISALVAAVKGWSVSDKFADWLIYRGSWIGIGIQAAVIGCVAWWVLHTETDSVVLAHTLLLTLTNAAWFCFLRVTFEFADWKHSRQQEPIE